MNVKKINGLWILYALGVVLVGLNDVLAEEEEKSGYLDGSGRETGNASRMTFVISVNR